jgi:autotransporter-associated beta strand protein
LGAVPAGAAYSGALTPANNTYRLGGGGGALTVSTALNGGNSLVVNGNVNLTGNISYSGSTTINAGLLAMSNAPNSTANSILVNAGGALSMSGPYGSVTGWLNSGLINTSSSGALALPAGSNNSESINLGSYGGLSLGAAPGGATFSGSINQGSNGVMLGGGGGPLTLTTAFGNDTVTIVSGMVIFTANDTSYNPTYVNGGTLEATTPSALPTQWFGNTNGIWVASGAVLAVQAQTAHAPNGWASADINTLFNNSPGLTQFVPGSSLGIDVVSGDTFTQTGNFPYGSGVGLVKFGPGTLLLSNTTYAATTTISAGTLQLGDGSGNNGSLDGGAGPGTGLIVNNAALVFANPSAQTYSGNISGTGALTKTSTGRLTLTGDNTLGGATNVSSGALEMDGRLATGVMNITGSGQLAGSGTITLTGGDDHLYYNSSATSTFAGALQGATDASLEVDSGNLILTGSNNTYEGGTDVYRGMLTVTTLGDLPTNQSLEIDAGGTFVFDPQQQNNSDSLVATPAGAISPVPEPGTLVLLLASLWIAVGHHVLMVGRRFSKRAENQLV